MNFRKLFDPRYLVHHRRRLAFRLGHTLRLPGSAASRNAHRLSRLHDSLAGQRAFVLGNGPSLTVADMRRLQGEITFASNKIFLAFDQTDWRPTYYTVSDVLVARNNAQRIASLPLTQVLGSSVMSELSGSNDTLWLPELSSPRQRFSTDCARGVYGGYSVVYLQLQLAFYLGIRELYLIGMDFDFKVQGVTDQKCEHGQVLESVGEQNHFHPDYRPPGELWTMPRLDRQEAAFQCAREAFEAHGGRIVNASRKSLLEVFPRGDLDQILDTSGTDARRAHQAA